MLEFLSILFPLTENHISLAPSYFSPLEKLDQKEGNGVGFGLNLVELVAWDFLCHQGDYLL